jgi:two-component system, LytTR family, response regulator LytT
MSKIKILVVEDELIIAEAMKDMLQNLDYEVIGIACDCVEAENLLQTDLPDIALIDIQLRDGDDGIALARSIKDKYNLPIIFITSHSDKTTVERVKDIQPQGYILKPFEKNDLYTSIEIALSNFLKSKTANLYENGSNYFLEEYLFVKENYKFKKVRSSDIEWIKSEGNYLEVFCKGGNKYLIRSTFDAFLNHISLKTFIQVHRSYAVNIDSVDLIQNDEIIINRTSIPIGKMFRDELIKRLNIVL